MPSAMRVPCTVRGVEYCSWPWTMRGVASSYSRPSESSHASVGTASSTAMRVSDGCAVPRLMRMMSA